MDSWTEAVALRDCGEVDLGVVDTIENVGEDDRCEGKTDVQQLRVGVSGDLNRCEIAIADGAAGFRECAEEADQRIAPGFARGLANRGSS